MKLIGIVAISENRCIGYKNRLPWHIPKDLLHFKNTTIGHPVIMGRKTYQSLPSRLKDRREIVLSKEWYKDRAFIDGIEVYPSVDHVIKSLQKANVDKAFIIGGSEVYKNTLRIINELLVTVIHTEVNGDKYFPKVDKRKFELVNKDHHKESKDNKYPITFLHYIRR